LKDGNILEDFNPSVNPPKEVDDPEDTKPNDWIDDPKIADPDATKPEDWDEDQPRLIPDENAEKPDNWLDDEPQEIAMPKPDEWDDEEDGEFEAVMEPNPKCEMVGCGEWTRPMISNPLYRGKWQAPLIDNPDYKGPWSPRQIPNPDYYEDSNPVAGIIFDALAIEILTNQGGVHFDNFIIADNYEAAKAYADSTFAVKREREKEAQTKAHKLAENEDIKVKMNSDNMTLRILGYIDMVVAAAKENIIAAVITIVILIGFPCYGFLTWMSGDLKKSAVENDNETDEDKEEEEEEEEEEEVSTPKGKVKATPKSRSTKGKPNKKKIEEDDDDGKESEPEPKAEPEPMSTKRRSRRTRS
jgi:calnexin